jgi:hypothetical protein
MSAEALKEISALLRNKHDLARAMARVPSARNQQEKGEIRPWFIADRFSASETRDPRRAIAASSEEPLAG